LFSLSTGNEAAEAVFGATVLVPSTELRITWVLFVCIPIPSFRQTQVFDRIVTASRIVDPRLCCSNIPEAPAPCRMARASRAKSAGGVAEHDDRSWLMRR